MAEATSYDRDAPMKRADQPMPTHPSGAAPTAADIPSRFPEPQITVFGAWRSWLQAAGSLAGQLPAPVIRQLAAAYQFAATAHAGQTRPAGEPYVRHLLEVVEILTYRRVTDPPLLVAALLHDVVEDTAETVAAIERLFGAQVARLVDQVTMPPAPTSEDKGAIRAEYLTRLATAPESVRVLKLADRYSNVQRLHTHPRPAKQRAYYRETCQYFLPIAATDTCFAELYATWRVAYAHLA